MKSGKARVLVGLTILSFIAGCAPTTLKPELIGRTRRLAVLSFVAKEPRVLDHTCISEASKYSDSYGYCSQYGQLGLGLVGLFVSMAAAHGQIKSSLGGNPDSLKQAIADLPMKELFDQNFTRVLSKKFEIVIVGPGDVNEYVKTKSVNGEMVKDYGALHEHLGVDTVLEIHFSYGLAAYGGGVRPSAVVAGVVSVVNAENNKLLLTKDISSDLFYKSGHTVDEFTANGGKLFRKEILEAVRGFAHLVGAEFGVDPSLKEKSYWRPKGDR